MKNEFKRKKFESPKKEQEVCFSEKTKRKEQQKQQKQDLKERNRRLIPLRRRKKKDLGKIFEGSL